MTAGSLYLLFTCSTARLLRFFAERKIWWSRAGSSRSPCGLSIGGVPPLAPCVVHRRAVSPPFVRGSLSPDPPRGSICESYHVILSPFGVCVLVEQSGIVPVALRALHWGRSPSGALRRAPQGCQPPICSGEPLPRSPSRFDLRELSRYLIAFRRLRAGGAERDRTADLRDANAALSQTELLPHQGTKRAGLIVSNRHRLVQQLKP